MKIIKSLFVMLLLLVGFGCFSEKVNRDKQEELENSKRSNANSLQNVYFRGTPNNWGLKSMEKLTDSIYKTEVHFDGKGDENGVDRFKVDISGNWTEAYPKNDYLMNYLESGYYEIIFNIETKEIRVFNARKNLSLKDKIYFRGTPNDWDLSEMTLIHDFVWTYKTNFDGNGDSNGVDRFKVDISGNWSEAFPENDYVINEKGMYVIVFYELSNNIEITKQESKFPKDIELIKSNQILGSISDIVFRGNYAYAVNGVDLMIFDIKNEPKLKYKYQMPLAENIEIYENYIFTSHWKYRYGNVAIYNIDEPENPRLVNHIANPATDIKIIDGKLYKLIEYNELEIYDISNLDNNIFPKFVDRIKLNYSPLTVGSNGRFVVVGHGKGVEVIDLLKEKDKIIYSEELGEKIEFVESIGLDFYCSSKDKAFMFEMYDDDEYCLVESNIFNKPGKVLEYKNYIFYQSENKINIYENEDYSIFIEINLEVENEIKNMIIIDEMLYIVEKDRYSLFGSK